jgi:hypothetical protein
MGPGTKAASIVAMIGLTLFSLILNLTVFAMMVDSCHTGGGTIDTSTIICRQASASDQYFCLFNILCLAILAIASVLLISKKSGKSIQYTIVLCYIFIFIPLSFMGGISLLSYLGAN